MSNNPIVKLKNYLLKNKSGKYSITNLDNDRVTRKKKSR
jgi:hypothetical protein